MIRKAKTIWLVVPLMMISKIALSDNIVAIDFDQSLSLAQVTDEIYQKLPDRSAQHSIEAQYNAYEAAANRTFASPTTANLQVFSDRIGSNDGMQEWEGGVDLPLWLPGQQSQNQLIADKINLQIPSHQRLLRLQASSELRSLIWDIIQAQTVLTHFQITHTTASQLEKDVKARVDAGDLASTEQLLATNHTLKARAQVIEAAANLQTKLKQYTLKTGLKALPTDYEEVLTSEQTISEKHPLLDYHNQRISVLKAEQSAARFSGAVNPNLSIGVRRERGDSHEDYTHSIGLGINVPLDNDKHNKVAIAEAGQALTDAEIERQKILLKLNAQLIEYQSQLAMQHDKLVLLEKQYMAAQQYLTLQKRAFELGEINLMTLLNSQVIANDSHHRKALLEVEVNRTKSSINQTLGITF